MAATSPWRETEADFLFRKDWKKLKQTKLVFYYCEIILPMSSDFEKNAYGFMSLYKSFVFKSHEWEKWGEQLSPRAYEYEGLWEA